MMPTFLGIGAPRCATTWMSTCLAAHPEVFMAAAKELNFFQYGSIEGRLPEYEAHFAGAEGKRAAGEISVRYLNSPVAAKRILEMVPGARLFVSLRNPADQVYSHFWHLLRQNFHQATSKGLPRTFEQAAQRFPELVLEPAYYGRHLEPWFGTFPRESILVLFYEEITADPAAALEALYRHLGVDPSFRPAGFDRPGSESRKGTSPRDEVRDALRARTYSGLHRMVYAPMKKVLGVRRADRVKSALRVRQTFELIFQKKGYPPLAAAERARLDDRYREDVARLGALLGRDLPAGWPRPGGGKP